MKYLIALLLLVGCTPKPPDIDTKLFCKNEIADAYENGQRQATKELKMKDEEKYAYGTRVVVLNGFYRGQTGRVVGDSSSDFGKIAINPDHVIFSENEKIKVLYVYPDDVKEIK